MILRGDARALDRAATARTCGRERRGVGLIDLRRNRSASPAPIPSAGAPTRPPTTALRTILGEGGRLPGTGTPRRLELLFETRILPLQLIAFAFAFRARQLVAQARDVLLLAFDQIVAFVAGRTWAFVGHATFMADSLKKYKYGILDLAWSRAETR